MRLKTKVVFISHSFERGGAQKYLYDFVRYCCSEGIECLVIGPRSGPQLEDFRILGVELRPISLTSIMGPGNFWRFKQFLKISLDTLQIMRILLRFRPVLVYTNTSVIISGALASRILKLPHFWHVHENFDTMDLSIVVPRKVLSRLIESLSVKVIFVSHLALKSIFPDSSHKAVVIQNGIDLSCFQFRNPSIRKGGMSRMCFLGALGRRKGVDTLLLALAYLRHEHATIVSLDIWGSGDSESASFLKNLTEKLGIARDVRFMGYVKNVNEILPEYDVLVVPSRGESFSLVVLEGMAVGVPVVATRCGGPEELIEDGIDGHLVEVGDYKHMAEVIKRFLDDPDYAGLLAIEARKKVLRSFDLQQQFQKIIQLLMPFLLKPQLD